MSYLPKKWGAIPLRDVVEIRKGKKPEQLNTGYQNDCIPYLDIEAIENGNIRRYADKESSRIGTEADIFMVWDGARSGWVGMGQAGAIGSTIMALLPKNIDKKYLFNFLKINFGAINTNHKGTGIPHVDPDYLWGMKIPCPPIEEQQRIAQKIDSILPNVQAIITRLDKIPVMLKRFRQSVIAAACSGKITEDWRMEQKNSGNVLAGWKRVPLESLIPKGGIFDGPFGSNLKSSDYTDTGIRVIRLENICKLSFIAGKETYISEAKYKTLTRHTVQEGDIIFSSFITDEIRACILPKLKTKAIAKADCFCVRPNETTNRNFLVYQLVSGVTYSALVENIHGATRPRINTRQLRKLDIGVCSLTEQREVVRRVEALFKFADDIEVKYRTARAKVGKLPQSILAKAFRGELA